MGQDVDPLTFADGDEHSAKVRRCRDVLAQMLADGAFRSAEATVGLEVELDLIDEAGRPALRNAAVLAAIDDGQFQTELAQYNIEVNVPPVAVAADGLEQLLDSLDGSLARAEAHAANLDTHVVAIGVLPTIGVEHFDDAVLTPNPRYRLLADRVLAARGGIVRLDIDGVERLTCEVASVLPEAACTSTQLHLQVAVEEFASHWNAAQMVACIQVATGANSPFLAGTQLWHETRIALFEQSIDPRSAEQRSAGDLPRVLFGTGWIASVLDLFDENLAAFPPVLPAMDDEEPGDEWAAGRPPALTELRVLNGTVYRWNRPVYDVAGGRPHLRIENRVLPAGPSVIDTLANAALFYGLVTQLAAERPWLDQPFATAERNFYAAARFGMAAEIQWPGAGRIGVADLVDNELAAVADRGLRALGVNGDIRRRLLTTVVDRCRSGQNGAAWQIAEFGRLRAAGAGRAEALRQMTLAYRRLMVSGRPVHTW